MARRRYHIAYLGREDRDHRFAVKAPNERVKPLVAETGIIDWLMNSATPGQFVMTRAADHTLQFTLKRPVDVIRFERRFGPIPDLTLDALEGKAA